MTSQTILLEEPAIALRSILPAASDHDNPLATHETAFEPLETTGPPKTSNLQKILLTAHLSFINLLASSATGVLTVGLPRIAADLHLPRELFFWPASVYGLAMGATLLLAGSVADVLGARGVDLAGCLVLGAFLLGSGLVRTGEQLVVFRALQGVAMSLHLSASVGIVTANLPRGRGRNLAFSCLGLSQPLGFSFGLVVGGVLIDGVGWRTGWYLSGGMTLVLALVGLWALPKGRETRHRSWVLRELADKVDWVGAIVASAFMATLSYLLAIISTDIGKIRNGESIVLICISCAAVPAFVYWVHRQVRLGKPALIPNKLWKNPSFSTMCLVVLLSFSALQSMEQYSSLFFQEVQHLPALQASIRILPSLIVGICLNLTTGLFVDRFPALWIVSVSSILCAVAPALMAVANPGHPYWYNAFFAQLLMPVSGDILFTIGLIVISDVFPEHTQALAGAVFNTASQFGTSLGLAIMQVVSTVTASKAASGGESSPSMALLSGYRASFWTMFGLMMSCFLLGALGLRKTGKVGSKRD